MKRPLLPTELDELMSTHAPLNGDPEFVSPFLIQAMHDRQQALLKRTRAIFGQVDGCDEPEDDSDSPCTLPTRIVLLVLLAFVLLGLALTSSARPFDARALP